MNYIKHYVSMLALLHYIVLLFYFQTTKLHAISIKLINSNIFICQSLFF